MSLSLAPTSLASLVLNKISALGDDAAATFFDVSKSTVISWRNGRTAPSIEAAQKVWDETLLCQAPEIWGAAGEKIQLLLPIYDNPEPLFMVTLIRAIRGYGIDKIGIIPKLRTLIEEARNDLAERALLTPAEWFVYADCDVVLPSGNGAMLRKQGCNLPEPKASRNAFERLMSHPKEYRIVAGLTRCRRGSGRVLCSTGYGSAQENERLNKLFTGENQSDSLEEVGWSAPGFMRIHRSVFEEMKAEAKPGGKLAEIAPPPPPRDKEGPGYWGRSAVWRGEDVALGRRAGILGIKTYIDHGLLLGHVGSKVY